MEPTDVQRLMILAEKTSSRLEAVSAGLEAVSAEQKLQRRIVIGNGDSDNSIIARLQRLEAKSSTMSFVVDKVVAPVIASVITAALILVILNTP